MARADSRSREQRIAVALWVLGAICFTMALASLAMAKDARAAYFFLGGIVSTFATRAWLGGVSE